MKFSQEPTLLCAAEISYTQKIEIYIGDITKLYGSDVLVNTANGALQHKGGLAKVIADKAFDEYVNQYGQIQEGDVWLTTEVGKLNCKEPLLYQVCTNSMKAAEGYTSISIPAISSGIFNFLIKECGMIITKAVRYSWWRQLLSAGNYLFFFLVFTYSWPGPLTLWPAPAPLWRGTYLLQVTGMQGFAMSWQVQTWGQVHEYLYLSTLKYKFESTCTLLKYFLNYLNVLVLILKYLLCT